MSDDRFVEAQKHHPLSIRRNVREPVVVVVGKDLHLLAAVGLYSPNMHVPGALGIEINVLPIRRIFRPIVESRCCRQSLLLATFHWNCVNVKIAVALPNKRQSSSVGRPPMPV